MSLFDVSLPVFFLWICTLQGVLEPVLPVLSYFHFKFYFPPCHVLFLLLTLNISPPSASQKHSSFL